MKPGSQFVMRLKRAHRCRERHMNIPGSGASWVSVESRTGQGPKKRDKGQCEWTQLSRRLVGRT